MNNPSQPPANIPFPANIRSMDDLVKLERLATRHALPYNHGELVWHSWGSGSKTGRPVVLFHGGSGSWTHWVRNVGALVAAGHQVLIPDMPGFGDSARPVSGEDADVLAEPLEWSLRQLIGTQQVDLVGFSFGSMVAAFLTRQWPERVRKLILMGAPALGVNATRPFKLRPWLDVPPGPDRDVIHRHNLGVLMMSGPDTVDELSVQIHGMNLARDRLQKRRLAYTQILLETIQLLDVPIHGIWGDQDVLYRGRHEALAAALAKARNLQSLDFIVGAGHWVQYEAAEAFNECLLRRLGD